MTETTDEEVVIRPKNAAQPRSQSAYMTLLTSLATDLDLMLNDLRSSSRFTSPQRASISVISQLGSDANNFRQRRYDLDNDDRNGSTLMDDDLQQLLPSSVKDSREDLCQSRASLVSSSDGGILAGEDTSSESALSGDSASPPCDLGLVERLLRTHPVWFLPGIQRAGAVHLLQGKEEGNFIVRGSSQTNTMAVSVRLPPATGPYIEHYLVQSNDALLSLESSRFKFDSIPALIAHYAQCCDELPVQLILPQALRDAKNRQQLSSLALLGQEFWRYPMATPKSKVSPTVSSSSQVKSPITETSGIGTILLSSPNQKTLGSSNPNSQQFLMSDAMQCTQVETPSDTASSLSSFTTSMGQQLLSPESIDSAMLMASPSLEVGRPVKTTSTFKINDTGNKKSFSNEVEKQIQLLNSNLFEVAKNLNDSNNNGGFQGSRVTRPTPPNTLSLAHLRTPPQPPPRWSKPPTPVSPTFNEANPQQKNNFTVTTTVTFSVDGQQSPQIVEVSSPTDSQVFQTISKRLSPEGECHVVHNGTLSSQGSKRWQQQQQTSKDKILSPILAETPTGRTKKSRRKESKHYQESDILESPSIYCRSALGDKISDYEDLWTQDNVINSPLGRGGNMSSFRPNGDNGKRPDILALHPIITSLNDNKLSPPSSVGSNCSPTPATQKTSALTKSTDQLISHFNAAAKANNHHNNNGHADNLNNNNNKTTTTNVVKRLFGGGRTPIDETLPSPNEASRNLKNLQTFSSTVNIDTTSMAPVSHRSSWHQAQHGQLNPILQPRNRLGLILSNNCEIPIEPCTPVAATPTSQNPSVISHSKQSSPFYAEPADTLNAAGLTATVMKRTTIHRNIPSSHRHSEPPKSPPMAPKCPISSPKDGEKAHFTGSLDELKKMHRKTRGRGDQWQLDSSWEFMGTDNQNGAADYDSDLQWRRNTSNKENLGMKAHNGRSKCVTVHQIIARRHPELNVHELMRCISPTDVMETSSETALGTFGRNSRVSAYDNVDKHNNHSGYASSFLNSAQSDDGTVFSEPWDSSQWDSFLPNDDAGSDTIHLSKCRSALCQSEDDTIVEDHSSATLTRQEHNNNNNNSKSSQASEGKGYLAAQNNKVATIVRNRSCRDREVLSHPRNKTTSGGPGDSVEAYALSLASDRTSTFARNIENFISCTKDSRESTPQVVMRNMRQFMSGMKNYLVKHGEGDFSREVQMARSKLKPDEFLNLDTILEGVMHRLIVLPLREHLYALFVDYYTRSGDIQLLVENVKYAGARTPTEFGIRSSVIPPKTPALRNISLLLLKLQEVELPLEKLEILLSTITSIFDATSGSQRGQALSADDFLPLLVYVVAKCGFIGAEIEAEYMWGLMQPSLLSGEAGYYLTALCSAVHVLKSFMTSDSEGTGSLDWRSSSLPACSSVLRVIIPDELNGSLQTRTLPVRPHTTTKEVCRIIAHKARITNPQDYGLFKLIEGEETALLDSECPQDARIAARGKHCILAYKRIDAKIAWPTSTACFQ